ncbi:MAG: copper resistance protein CopC [Pseudomonadales bacterium]|jgi:copper resistance protein C|nr:copper resistance protein CopC [Pseudomonadales bacterium]
MKIKFVSSQAFSLMTMSMRCVVLIACVFVSSIVSAHNVLKSSVPADGATLEGSPSELALEFNGQVRLVKLNLKIGEEEVEVGFKPNPTAASSFAIPVPELSPGAYALEFSIIGADGHTVAGHFNFGVGMPAAQEGAGH